MADALERDEAIVIEPVDPLGIFICGVIGFVGYACRCKGGWFLSDNSVAF